MEKKIEYYLGLPYTRELIPEPEGGWFVRIKELPGCMSQGETVDEAMEMINEALTGWIEVTLQRDCVVPEPQSGEDYSGKFVVRTSKSLHRKLAEAAEAEKVSLNQLVITALAETTGYLQAKSLFSSVSAKINKEDSLWSGLENGASNILEALCGGKPEKSKLESQFSAWLDDTEKMILNDVENGDYMQAKSRCDAWQNVIAQYQDQSPILTEINKIISSQNLLLRLLSDHENETNGLKRLYSQISQMISSSYVPETKKENEVEESEISTANEKKRSELKETIISLPHSGEKK